MYYRRGKAIYFKNNDEEQPTLIADAESEEKADAIIYHMNSQSSYFIRDALVTCSPEYHGDMVSRAEFIGRINGAIDALNKLDQVKKTLFYGRDNNLNPPEGKRDATDIPASVYSNRGVAVDIMHAIIGFATEAGELLEALKNAYNGNGFDWVNIQEELGDAAWYAAILAARGDFTFEEYQNRIIKKLKQRYADKFTAAEAVDRDLVAERAILEDRELGSEGGMLVEPLPATEESFSSPHLKPTQPASGSEAVKEVEAEADAAFDAVNAVKPNMEDAPVTGGTNRDDLSKPLGYRDGPLPDEHLARQPVRSEDLENDE